MSVTGSVVVSNDKVFTFFFFFYWLVQIYQLKSAIFSGTIEITPVLPVKKPTCRVGEAKKKTPLGHRSPVSLIGIGVQHVSIVVVEEDLHHEN